MDAQAEVPETPEAVRRREVMARILMERAATELDPTAQWYPDIDLAAVEALNRLGDVLKEHGGVIYRNREGMYSYSVPVPGSNDHFDLRAKRPPDLELAGIYHPHLPGSQSHLFSSNDVETARKLKLLSFIKILSNGEIRRFDPATSKTEIPRDLSRGDRRRQKELVSRGELVEGRKP